MLTTFLAESKIDFNGGLVVELGAGHGLPGIYLMSQGAKVCARLAYFYGVHAMFW